QYLNRNYSAFGVSSYKVTHQPSADFLELQVENQSDCYLLQKVSLHRIIPCRVAPQQCPTPLHSVVQK
ncbi:MAG: hypothetical protein ACI85O_002740, partial [Saprospiraceae bacterium]